jgi:hypothetical protein
LHRDTENPVTKTQSEYLSFLLRLWRVSVDVSSDPDSEEMVWRFSLQDTLTDERASFTDLKDLVAFLRRKMDAGWDGGSEATRSQARRTTKSQRQH